MKRIVLLLFFASIKVFGQSAKMEVVGATSENVDGIYVNLKSTTSELSCGVRAINNSTLGQTAGIYGEANANGAYGVWGKSANIGLYGYSPNGKGLSAGSDNGIAGYFFSLNGAALVTGLGNIGISTFTPKYQLTFKSELGDKISFWGGETSNTTPHYGIGVQGGTLQFFVPTTGDNLVFGVGRSGAFSEKFRITGNGNLQNSGVDAGYRFYDRNTTAKSFQWYSLNGQAFLFRHHNGAGNVLTVLENGDLEVGAYTKLGNTVPAGAAAGATAPAIKTLKLVGQTANSEGSSASVNTGIAASKILSISILVKILGFGGADDLIPSGFTYNAGLEFNYYCEGSVIYISNVSGNSSGILNKPFKVFITYEE